MSSQSLSQGDVSLELPNVGPGPDPASLDDFLDHYDFTVVLLQRDHYCTNCRKQVQAVADRYSEFLARGAQVVSVLPEPRKKAAKWQDSYDLPYPLLADPEAEAGAQFDQPVRFGILGSLPEFLGRMPEAIIIDGLGDPEIAWEYAGSSTFDRPSVDDLLAALDDQ